MPKRDAAKLRSLVKQGKAMPAPGQDRPARFPIANHEDLENAIRAVGRNDLNGDDCVRGEVEPLIEMQDQINSTISNLLMAQQYAAFLPGTCADDGSLKK